jgi:hypothetical protein
LCRFPIETALPVQLIMAAMRQPEHFEAKKEFAVLCPVGQFSFVEMVELMSRAVLFCREQKIGKLLIDSTGLAEFHPPGIGGRFNLAERFASEAASLVKIAHVANAEWVREGKFGVEVGRNRGLDAQNFRSKAAAMRWLLKPIEKKSVRGASDKRRLSQ